MLWHLVTDLAPAALGSDAQKHSQRHKEHLMGPGMFDDVPKVLGCFALLLIAVALGAGFLLGRL